MAEQTGISWCDATFNPWVGCSKVSPGCAHCYAETLVTGRMGRAGTWGDDGVRERTSPGLWQKPTHWAALAREGRLPNGDENKDGHRPRVFCASLADVFEPRPELEPWRFDLFALIDATPELDWLVLTKRPDHALEWLEQWYVEHGVRTGKFVSAWSSRDGLGWGCPQNLWMGVSIENSRHSFRADILRQIPAPVRFISAEPLLGSLFDVGREGDKHGTDAPVGHRDQSSDDSKATYPSLRTPLDLDGIDWVIVGGESGGKTARPMHPRWAREIRDACAGERISLRALPGGEAVGEVDLAPIAFHFKQWGSWRIGRGDYSGSALTGYRRTVRESILLDAEGRRRDTNELSTFTLPDDWERMEYAGAAPKSGGKLLDGVEWCEFPELMLTPA